MKTKHTPGPWNYDSSDNIVYGPNGTTVCGVHLKPKIVGVDDLEKSGRSLQTLANANLIAAAPELLAACEAAIRLIDRIGQREHPAFDRLFDAIKKVKREQL